MGKRRIKKKQKQKIIRSAVTLGILIIVALLSLILKPWDNSGSSNLGDGRDLNPSDLQVHYIDVGQADSILIRVPSENGQLNMLIDAGAPLRESSKDKVITEYLAGLGIDTLHYMIITHPHFDHASAAAEVIEAVNVQNLILPECEATQAFWIDMFEAMEAKNLEYIPSEMGDTYQIGEASFEILGPVDLSLGEDNPNNYSVVVRLDYGKTSFLFTGDAEVESEEAMLKAQPASKFKCDVLKVGHHGAANATSEALLAAAKPSLAIIQCGEGNSYGHPTQLILDRLADANVPVRRTDLEGTIIICSDKKEVYPANK
ncbi:MAG: MBL fold metallo-hydrolase [Ruminococcaceae bacterium]|nr:MBL fold metallo-hydrolase [Oscillospiraceae bacterium]